MWWRRGAGRAAQQDATVRVATWNTKQAVAPRLNAAGAWQWMEDAIDPDVVVLTESKMPPAGVPEGWSALWEPEGYGPKKKWGTILAVRGMGLERVTEVRVGRQRHELVPTWPAGAVVGDVSVGSERWATVVGLYGLTVNRRGESVGHGGYSVPRMLADLGHLLDSDRARRLVLAGDLNLHPHDVTRHLADTGLVDLIAWTREDRPALEGCLGCDLGEECGHMWTHKNPGGKNPSAQQIDYLFASEELADEVGAVFGGYESFPEAVSASDHAPVVADFRAH